MIRGSDWLTIIIRVTFLIVVLVAAIYLYRRYEVVHLAPDDNSMEIVVKAPNQRDKILGHPRGGYVLVDLWAPLDRNQVAAYGRVAGDKEEEEIRAGRIWGVPGDVFFQAREGISIHGELMKVGGAVVHHVPEPLLGQSFLQDDQYFLLNDNPDSMQPDGRNYGSMPRARIRGVIVRNWPW